MARAHFADVLLGTSGSGALSLLDGATVHVYDQGTTDAIAQTIYAADSGGTTLSNPLTSDANGKIEFWLATAARVDLVASKTGYTTSTRTVDVEDAPSGGTVPVLTLTANGLLTDTDPRLVALGDLSGQRVLFVDPRVQERQAEARYDAATLASGTTFGAGRNGAGALVRAVGGTGVFLVWAVAARTGAEEPTWSTDGATHVLDHEVEWQPEFLLKAWAALATFAGADAVVKASTLFIVSEGGGGNSGAVEPSWASAPNHGDTLIDGDLTWLNLGAAAPWSANARVFREVPNPADPTTKVIAYHVPSAPVAGTDYAISMGGQTTRFGTSGSAEPDWSDAAPGEGTYVLDADLLWKEVETGAGQTNAVLTGLPAPAAAASLLVVNVGVVDGADSSATFADQSSVGSDYGEDVLPAAGQGFDQGGATANLNARAQTTLNYLPSQATWLVAPVP